MAELDADSILENAAGPRSASDDAGSFQTHSIDDQIKAVKFKNSKAATAAKGFGLRIKRFKPPSALGE